MFILFGLFKKLYFGFFGYVYEDLWLFEVKWVFLVCCKVWIALVCVVQHVGSCVQILQALNTTK